MFSKKWTQYEESMEWKYTFDMSGERGSVPFLDLPIIPPLEPDFSVTFPSTPFSPFCSLDPTTVECNGASTTTDPDWDGMRPYKRTTDPSFQF